MDEKRLFEILRELGLSRREAEIYLFLWKKGPQKAHGVVTYLDIDRAQTYRALTSMQEKGLVEVTIEAPTRYAAVPIQPLVESLINTKKSEVTHLESEKDDLINYLESISTGEPEPEYPIAKLQVVVGKNGIYSKIIQMANESKKEALGLTTSIGLIQEDMADVLDAIIDSAQQKRDVQFKMLANITKENLHIIKRVTKRKTAKNANVEWRHIDLGSNFYQRFVIKDEEETLLYLTSRDELSTVQEDTGLWITSRMFVSTLKASFMELWRNAVDVKERIRELETGKPIEETVVIKDPEEAEARVKNVLGSTKNEVTLISSSAGVNRIVKNDPFKKYSEKGTKFNIMAPIDLDNLAAAQKLSKLYRVKHVPISYLTMMIADNKRLFIFKAPPLEEATVESPLYLRDVFYTNDQKFVERASELLNGIWKRGTLVSDIGSEGSGGTPIAEVSGSDSVLKVVDVMLKNSVTSVLVTENNDVKGIVDQRDILDKVLKALKSPHKTTANEIMSTPVLTIDSDESLIDAMRTMREKRIPRLAVMRNGKLVAVLT